LFEKSSSVTRPVALYCIVLISGFGKGKNPFDSEQYSLGFQIGDDLLEPEALKVPIYQFLQLET
jgi:hypothetical protein